MFQLIGVLSGVLALLADVPYIADILRGKTKPHRVSWSVFLTLNVINLFNQVAIGASYSLWLIAGFVAAQVVIVGLSIKRGVGGTSKLDLLCLAGAATGIGLWVYFQTALASIIANIAVGSIVLMPTAVKAFKRPATETKSTWLVGSLASALGAIAVGKLDVALLLLPIYSFVAQLLIYGLIQFGSLLKTARKANSVS